MKFFTNSMKQCLALSLVFLLTTGGLWAQIQFEGLYSEGEGGAAWNADGSGEEAYGNGHDNYYYYAATRDYVDPTCSSGVHMTNIGSDFSSFEEILLDYGFSLDQMTLKLGLSNMGEDIEGMDYFTIDGTHYANYYTILCTIELDGYPMIEAIGDYSVYTSATNIRSFKSGYLKVNNIASASSNAVINVTRAFMQALEDSEIALTIDITGTASFSGNGRSGGFYDMNISLEKGFPSLPFQGLYADNEGSAVWNADGSGPEPAGNGHQNMLYYVASVDYDGINSNPEACLGHFLEGSTGFINTLIQLQYRGFEIGDLKMKMGLMSLGPDVEGEDWGEENGEHWLNEYNSASIIEINGEPILKSLTDTIKMVDMNSYWRTSSSVAKLYDISQNASPEAQFVAQSLLKDLGSHYINTRISSLSYTTAFSDPENGRNGAYYQIDAGEIVGVHHQTTFVNEGSVSGTWTLENSPYYIEGPLLIEQNQTLSIEEGVKIAIRGPYPLVVEGNIMAQGSKDNPIQFSSSNPNIYWDGFDYEGMNIISVAPSIFDHCLFQYGLASGGSEYNSGGVFAVRAYDDIEIYNSVFQNNIAEILSNFPTCGGAIALSDADIMIQSCVFKDNYALDYGGAILVYEYSNPTISNCLFYDNESSKGGAIAFYDYSNGIVINNTMANNMAEVGGAIYFHNNSSPEIINTILWNNEASMEGAQVFFSGNVSQPGFYFNDIEEGLEGFGGNIPDIDYLFNIEEDPIFNHENFPYLQTEESPCINEGSPDGSVWYYEALLPAECLCGADRHLENNIDMGCYEVEKGMGLEDLYKSDDIAISPNPVRTTALLQYELEESGMLRIEIFNLMGQQVEEVFNAYQTAGEQSYNLNAESYQRGHYLIKISSPNQSYLSKFIKY